jgi:uncharacterized protein
MESVIENALALVREKLGEESTGHDYWHAWRVWNLAKKIGSVERCEKMLVVELAAILHDLVDDKVGALSPGELRRWLAENGADPDTTEEVMNIITHISFKGAGVEDAPLSRAGEIVRDADRLDAMGAIGIARCFATGARMGHPLHEPGKEPVLHGNYEEYRGAKGTSINHFYEKLLLLKDRMHTGTAKKIAEERHRYMLEFLDRFFKEWNGEL